MIRKRNANAAIFLLITVCFLLIISGCTSAPSHFSGENEENELNGVNGSTDVANGEKETPILLPDKELLDKMRREILGIDENEVIDYEIFDDVIDIIIENAEGKTEYSLSNGDTSPLSFHIQDISYLLVFENLWIAQIYDLPIFSVPDLSALRNLKHINFSNCSIRSLEGLKNVKSLENLYINNFSEEIHIEDLFKISNLENLKELSIVGALLSDEDITFFSTDCPLTNSLERVALDVNVLTSLSAFANMPKLWNLSCGYNKISTPYIAVDSQIANSLGSLSLYGNNINSLKGLSHLKRLFSLDVSWNNIKKFDISKESRVYSTLTYLYLKGTELEKLDGIVDLSNLRYLDLTENSSVNFNQLAKAKFLDKLEELYLDEDAVIEAELLNMLPVKYSYPEEYD